MLIRIGFAAAAAAVLMPALIRPPLFVTATFRSSSGGLLNSVNVSSDKGTGSPLLVPDTSKVMLATCAARAEKMKAAYFIFKFSTLFRLGRA